MNESSVPAGYHTVTPYLATPDIIGLMDFLCAAFSATVKERIDLPDGSIAHAEVLIGDSVIMLSGTKGCQPIIGAFYLYVADVDAVYRSALAAGATTVSEPEDQFWGDRKGAVRDQFGNLWEIATRVEEVGPAELERRIAAFSGV